MTSPCLPGATVAHSVAQSPPKPAICAQIAWRVTVQVLTSSLDRVKLYHQGATVYRRALVVLGPEQTPHELEIPGLPLALADASVKLRVLGSQASQVTLTQVRVGLHVQAPEAPLQTPDEAELQTLKRRHALRSHQRELLQQEQALFEAIRLPPRQRGDHHRPPPASPMKARVALEEVTHRAIQTRQQALRALRQELRELERQIAQRQDALERASQSRRARAEQVTKTAMVAVERHADSQGPLELELELEYFVDGARWAPQYQCRIARDGGDARLIMRAVICQGTGEDWRGVRLELSTASPMTWTQLPTLRALRIGRAQPPAPTSRGFRPPPQGAQALFTDYDQSQRRAQTALPAPDAWRAPALGAASLELPRLDAALQRVLASAQLAEDTGGLHAANEYDMDEDDAGYAYEVAAPEPMAEAVSYARHESFGAPPPMPSAPMPRSAPAPAPPPALAAPPAPQRAKKAASPSRSQGVSLQPHDELAELDALLASLEEPGAGAATGADFHALWLPEPGHAQRGKLQPVAALERYRQTLLRSGLTPDFDLEALLAHHIQRAQAATRAPLPSGTQPVRQAAGVFDYVYLTRDRVDVPSDGAFHSVPVDERQAPCELHYVVVPREDAQVYRVAQLENPTRAPLLTGPAELYVADEYILTTTLPTVPPRGRFKLGLGVEQSIKCARNTSFEERRSGQAVVATSELWHRLQIELINRLGRAVSCEVRERIPQPDKDAEVVVEEASVEPAWQPYDQRELGLAIRGGRRWIVSLQPDEPTTLKAEYVVKIYANNEIVGGNRREL